MPSTLVSTTAVFLDMLTAVKPQSRWNPLAPPFVHRSRSSPSANTHPAQHQPHQPPAASQPQHQPQTQNIMFNSHPDATASTVTVTVSPQLTSTLVRQPYDVFLVLDVEATCMQGTDFQWPNEIIEWPVCLLKWTDKQKDCTASRLEVVDEFRSFVRPTWRPMLSQFCTQLTGITQAQVDSAPHFPQVVNQFNAFLVKNGLIHPVTGERLVRFCWCSDGPFDVRDFAVKQCFISKIAMPKWLTGDVMDVRKVVGEWHERERANTQPSSSSKKSMFPRRISMNIESQLRALGLGSFQGRQHSGIDDTRNIARIVTELARRGITLQPNTYIHPGKRWAWMGKSGQILEEYCLSPGMMQASGMTTPPKSSFSSTAYGSTLPASSSSSSGPGSPTLSSSSGSSLDSGHSGSATPGTSPSSGSSSYSPAHSQSPKSPSHSHSHSQPHFPVHGHAHGYPAVAATASVGHPPIYSRVTSSRPHSHSHPHPRSQYNRSHAQIPGQTHQQQYQYVPPGSRAHV